MCLLFFLFLFHVFIVFKWFVLKLFIFLSGSCQINCLVSSFWTFVWCMALFGIMKIFVASWNCIKIITTWWIFVGLIFYLLRFYVGFPKFSIRAFPLLTSYFCFSCWLGMNEHGVPWLWAFHFSSCISIFLASRMAFYNVCTGCNSSFFVCKPSKNRPIIWAFISQRLFVP